MESQNFESMSNEEIAQFVKNSAPEKIEASVPYMSKEQIKRVVRQVDKGADPKWNEKTRSVILGLSQRPQLEAAASGLSTEQIIELIDKTLQVEDKHHWKLSPLLIGIPFETFSDLIKQATDREMHVLQLEGVTEPVQHQLTALGHDYEIQIEKMEKEIDSLCEEIEQLKLEEATREDVSEMLHKIGLFAEFFERTFQDASKALAVAWNTNRLDLIEAFNKIKDSCQKFNLYGIGFPSRPDSAATGLYKALEEKLFSIYGNPADTPDRDALRDNEPAIEGLVKFSVWYLRDYWELGLLPTVKDPQELDVDLSVHSESERTLFREDLFSQAQQNLEKIGLRTVFDLKQASIFSKKTLQEYIQENLGQSSVAADTRK